MNKSKEELKKEQYIEQAKELEKFKIDKEAYHCYWDSLIKKILKENGFEEIAEMYNKASECFWYA